MATNIRSVTAIPTSALDLAHQHEQSILAAQHANPVQTSSAPAGQVLRPVRLSQGPIQTKAEFERRQQEKDGFDPNLHRTFSSHHEAVAYRRENGIASLSPAEYEKEFNGGAPSLASHPAFSGGGMVSSHKRFAKPDFSQLPEGMTPESFMRGFISGKGKPPTTGT